MIITYNFNNEDFDYEIEFEEKDKALKEILLKETKESLVDILLNFDTCSVNLGKFFKEDLAEFFREKAYKEYKDRRDSE